MRFVGRLILLFMLACPALSAPALPDWVTEALRFDHYWYTYLHRVLGCPGPLNQPVALGSCNYNRSVLDSLAFAHARELAKDIFALEEKRH